MEREHRLKLPDGRVLACLELGAPSGPAAIYLHGYPGSRLEARLVADAAQRWRVRLLAPDRPGFGESTFQPGRTIGAWGADMMQLADGFALERFCVIGVSGGGPYALACAAHLPDRLSRIALVGSVAPIDQKDLVDGMLSIHRVALAAGSRTPRLAELGIGLVAQLIRSHPERFVAQMMARTSPADRRVLADASYRKMMLDSTAEALRQAGTFIARELILLARPWDISLESIRTPVTIWQGLADNIVPAAMARYLAHALAQSELLCLPDEGHLSLIVQHSDRVFADLTGHPLGDRP